MAIDVTTLALAKAYAKGLLESWSGSIGKNVTIESIVAIDGGNRITFGFTDDNGVAQEKTLDVMDGKDGADGKNGTNGTNGKDGVSTTHSWNGTTLTITSASGTSSADLKGDPGTTDFNALENKPTTENWTFTLEDGSTVTKAVYVG